MYKKRLFSSLWLGLFTKMAALILVAVHVTSTLSSPECANEFSPIDMESGLLRKIASPGWIFLTSIVKPVFETLL